MGNSRLSFDSEKGYARVNQQDDYMPFGMEISGLYKDPKNEYLYNRKELQEETGLYDYGARFYDPVVARWTTIDPMAYVYMSVTPYNYVVNNPIKFVDPNGMDYQNGIYESGLYGNTTVYSAGGEKGVFYGHNYVKDQNGNKIAGSDYYYKEGNEQPPGNDPRVINWKILNGAWKRRTSAALKAYGNTLKERFFSRFWYDKLFQKGAFEPQPGMIETDVTSDNPILQLLIPGGVEAAGTTVLGSAGKYEKLAEELSANVFKIPDGIWKHLTDAERWSANVNFLNRVIARGDQIVLSNSGFDAIPGTFFYKELQYLTSRGYTLTQDGMSLIK